MTKTIHYCDICEKEAATVNLVLPIPIRLQATDELTFIQKEVEVCKECCGDLSKLLGRNLINENKARNLLFGESD